MMADCIFCDIVAKKAPAEIVHEDEQAVAFRDINGLAPVHLLVVPRTHVESIDALEDDERLVFDFRAPSLSECTDRMQRFGEDIIRRGK